MDAPMLLPWLARKWDVSDARALELWRQACRDAEAVRGEHVSSKYWDIAKGRLIDLLDDKVMARCSVLETPWVMIQLNLRRVYAWLHYWTGARGHTLLT